MEERVTLGQIAGMFEGVNSRFDSIDGRFDEIDRHFEKVDRRLEKIDERLEEIEERFEKVDQRFDRIDSRFGEIDKHFGEIDRRFAGMDVCLEDMEERIISGVNSAIQSMHNELGAFREEHAEDMSNINERLDRTNVFMSDLYENHERRLKFLESA